MTKAEIQLVRSLADKRGRTQHGLFVAEGEKLIGELRASHLRIRKIFALEGVFEGPEVEPVSPRDMERLSQLKTANNSLALVEIPRHDLGTVHADEELVLALDEVQNPGNLGTIVRLADWFGMDQQAWKNRLVLCVPLLAVGAFVSQLDYSIVWRYFSWTNQTLAMIVLWTASMYLFMEKKNYWTYGGTGHFYERRVHDLFLCSA